MTELQDEPTPDGLAYYGEFADIAPLLAERGQLRFLTGRDAACLILPGDVLPGVTAAYGLPVVRADVDEPMLGLTSVPARPRPHQTDE